METLSKVVSSASHLFPLDIGAKRRYWVDGMAQLVALAPDIKLTVSERRCFTLLLPSGESAAISLREVNDLIPEPKTGLAARAEWLVYGRTLKLIGKWDIRGASCRPHQNSHPAIIESYATKCAESVSY